MSILVIAKNTLKTLKNVFAAQKSRKKAVEIPPKPWLQHYDLGVPQELYIPEITLNDILSRTVESYKTRTAFYYFGKKYSYSQFEIAVQRMAGAFQQLGIQKGDRVALILPNTPQFLFSYWAALRIGAIAVPLNPLLSGREMATLLTIAEPKLVIVLDFLYKKIASQITRCSFQYIALTSVGTFMPIMARSLYRLKNGFVRQKIKTNHARMISFKKLSIRAPLLSAVSLKPHDTAVFIFTGGVTGTPKAVQLTHRNLVANVLQTRAWLGNLKDGQDIVIGVLPFFHSYGMTACHHLAIRVGAKLIVEPRFNVQRVIHLVKKYKVTIFPGVPTMYRAIVDAVMDSKKRLEHVRVCVSGGAPLSKALKKQFEEWTSSKLVEGYGLSEASPLTHCNPLYGRENPGSIGLPCPNTEARIVHLKTGESLPPDEIGELQVKGPQVMYAYWRNEAETKKVLAPDGWLSTGDIARMDNDGFFYIVDRKKELILTGGFNVYPSEVEKVLLTYPGVKECAVVGAADDYYGEIAQAYVVVRRGETCNKENLLTYCRENLAHYKVPKQIFFVDALPKNFLGKVVKRNLLDAIKNSSK